jgi:5-methylcytosine-specific restriction enzyme subunit McrC
MSEIIHVIMNEWQTRKPERGSGLDGLSLGTKADRELVERLEQFSMLKVSELRTGLQIETYSFVGKLRIGNLEVTIQPKIEHSTFLNLLRYAYGFRKLKLFASTSQPTDRSSYEDLLVCQLNSEVRELISRGLFRAFVSRRERLASPRGRIDLQAIAAEAGMPTTSLPCRHYSRIEDSVLNRVLLAGLRLAATVANDIELSRESRRLMSALDERVSHIDLSRTVLRQTFQRLTRLTTAYAPAVNIVSLLFQSHGVSLEDSDHPIQLPGFLFDMSRFFQALVSRFLRDNLPGYEFREEYALSDMMQYMSNFNPQRHRSPTPRPDFVVLKGRKIQAMLDAKYRDIWERSLTRDMLFQLSLYAVSNGEKMATILYPTTFNEASESRIEIRDPVSGDRIARVGIRPVHLPSLDGLINSPPSSDTERRKQAFAESLAFGLRRL